MLFACNQGNKGASDTFHRGIRPRAVYDFNQQLKFNNNNNNNNNLFYTVI